MVLIQEQKTAHNILNSLSNSQHTLVLTGAGISTESGVPDYHTIDQTWTYNIPREKAMSFHFFNEDPYTFWDIFHTIHAPQSVSTPNPFHYFLAQLEEKHNVTIVTQ